MGDPQTNAPGRGRIPERPILDAMPGSYQRILRMRALPEGMNTQRTLRSMTVAAAVVAGALLLSSCATSDEPTTPRGPGSEVTAPAPHNAIDGGRGEGKDGPAFAGPGAPGAPDGPGGPDHGPRPEDRGDGPRAAGPDGQGLERGRPAPPGHHGSPGAPGGARPAGPEAREHDETHPAPVGPDAPDAPPAPDGPRGAGPQYGSA